MLDHSPDAAAAIESPERSWRHRLLIDWDGDGSWDHELTDLSAYVSRTVRDQSISATAPEELQLIEGHAAGKLTVEASGTYAGLSLAGHFAPYNGRSVFYSTGITLGVSGTYEIGVDTAAGPEWFRQFTGVVRDIYTNRATSGVTIELLDNIERLRTSVDIPPYGLWQEYLQQGWKRGMLCDSSSIIDLAARAGEFTMGPQRFPTYPQAWEDDGQASMVFSAPMHGSVLPELGMLDNYQEFHKTELWERSASAEEQAHAEAYTRGPHGYLALAALPDTPDGATMQKNMYWCDDARGVAGHLWGVWLLSAWVYYDGDRANHAYSRVCMIRIRGNEFRLIVECATGRVWGELQTHSGGPLYIGPAVTMAGTGWHYIEAGLANDPSPEFVDLRTRVDDVTSPLTRETTVYPGDINDELSGLVTTERVYAVSDVTIFQSNFYNVLEPGYMSRDLTPLDTARVSWGRNRITHTLRESGRESWDLASEVAAAEFGVVLFDEHGRFVFWNYDDITARQGTVVRTFTIDTLARLGLRNALDSVRNVWTVTTESGRSRSATVYDLGQDGVPLYESGGQYYPHPFILPATSYTELFVPVDDHTIAVEPGRLPHNPDDFTIWDQYVPEHGCMSYTGPTLRSSGPDSEQKMVTRDMFRQWLSNGWAEPVGFVSENGQPRFRVAGTRVFTDKPRTWTLIDQASIDRHGERVLDVSGNFWLQDEFQTKAMLRDLVSRLGRPIPVSDAVTVPMDPRTQIGDTVGFTDPEGFGADMRLQLYGIRRELSSDGAADTYSIEMVEPPAEAGIWDHASYGLWDQSLIWGG